MVSCRECRKMLLWLALSARMCVLACQDQHTLPKWNILSSCYCGLLSLLVCVYWPARTSTPSQSEIFSQAVIVACSLCSYVCIGLPGPAHPPKVKYSLKAIFVVSVRKMLLWLALSARMCVLACQDQHTLPKWNILSSYCGLLSLLVCVYWPARTSTPSQSEIFSQAVIVACSLCSYVCIGLPGPAHPPKVKYSLKAIFVVSVERCYCGLLSLLVCVYWPARTSTPSQSEIFSQAVIVACSLCSYVCIGLPGPAHPPKVKYSLKAIFVVSVERSNTAYNSLHIDCIGFMSWVSKDVIVACSLCSYVCIGLPGPAHPPKVKYSLKLLLWLALSARMCVLACQDQHTLPKWNILSKLFLSWVSKDVIVACSLCSYVCIGLPGPAHPPKVKYSLKLLLWLALSARMCVLACQDQHTLPKWNILSKLFLSWVSKDQTQHTIVYT